MMQNSQTNLGESFQVFTDIPFVNLQENEKRNSVLARYSINGASPAAPELVRFEQAVISDDVEARLIRSLPTSNFPDSMRRMFMYANENTFASLGIENQCSYAAVRDIESSTILLELARMKYERGLATPREGLDTVIDLGANSGELLKRTELSQEMPAGLVSELASLMAVVEEYQGPLDASGVSRRSVKIKQIDTPIGTGGANGLIMSVKSDIATINNGEYTLTCRTKYVVDFNRLPMRWRSQLRKLIASVEVRNKEDGRTKPQTMGMSALRQLSVYSSLDEHIHCGSMDIKMEDSENARMAALQEQLLDCSNPENPGETLRDADIEKPYSYHFTTTAYVYRTRL